MNYNNETFGFNGNASDIDSYFTTESFTEMFGECSLSEDDLAELRRQAHADLDGSTADDAREAAEAAVEQGFFATWSLANDEGPYYGDTELALRGTVYGDANREATEPFAFDVEDIDEDDMSEWVEAYRDRLFELGCKELGVDAE